MTDFLDVVNRMGLVVIPSSGGHLLVEGDVDLSGSDIATLPDNLSIIGSLIARECARLSTLPAGLNIMNSLESTGRCCSMWKKYRVRWRGGGSPLRR